MASLFMKIQHGYEASDRIIEVQTGTSFEELCLYQPEYILTVLFTDDSEDLLYAFRASDISEEEAMLAVAEIVASIEHL